MFLDQSSATIDHLSRSLEPAQQALLGERQDLRAGRAARRRRRLEAEVGVRTLRARAAAAHAGHLDQPVELELRRAVLPTAERPLGQQHRVQPRLQIVGRVGRVGRAVEEAAEEAVALLADRADARQHAVERHADQEQRVRREHQAAFEHFRHDLGRAGLQQRIELAVVDRAHDHRQPRAASRARGAGSCSAVGVSAKVIATARAFAQPAAISASRRPASP